MLHNQLVARVYESQYIILTFVCTQRTRDHTYPPKLVDPSAFCTLFYGTLIPCWQLRVGLDAGLGSDLIVCSSCLVGLSQEL